MAEDVNSTQLQSRLEISIVRSVVDESADKPKVELQWHTGAALESTEDPAGEWERVENATSPHQAPVDESQKFYRIDDATNPARWLVEEVITDMIKDSQYVAEDLLAE